MPQGNDGWYPDAEASLAALGYGSAQPGPAPAQHPRVEEKGGILPEGGSKARADGAESAAPFESSVLNIVSLRGGKKGKSVFVAATSLRRSAEPRHGRANTC